MAAPASLVLGPPLSGPTIPSSSDNLLFELLDSYPDTASLRCAHARMLRLGILSHPHPAGRLVAACCLRPSCRDPAYALRIFRHHVPCPDLYTWNVLIRAHASSGLPHLALLLFSQLLRDSPYRPDKFTFPFAVKAASDASASGEGRALHGMVVKSPFHSDVYVLNSLVHFYGAIGHLEIAQQLFDRIPERDIVSWNTMITAAARVGCCDEALGMFKEMEECEGVTPNDVTVLAALSACGKKGDLEMGRWVRSYVDRGGIRQGLILWNAMLDMYVKCGSLEDAKKLFDWMPQKDTISWTTMLVGLAKAGDFEAAGHLFDEMPSERDIACWNALISAYEQGGRPKESLELFRQALAAEVRPDQVTLVAALSACAQLGAMDMGRWIHTYMNKNGVGLNFHLATSLIDMYSKCGDLEKALEVFHSAGEKDVFVWSAMIAGLGMYGEGKAAIDLFLQMQEARVRPNGVTFINVLASCSHAGLVEEGKRYFEEMLPVYGVEPGIEHYGVMADILARAGRFEEATGLIARMPMTPHASIWGALLGACAIHGNTRLGEEAGDRLLELEPGNDGAYVLLSNLYAKSGRWESVGRLRKEMKDRGVRKEPGCSSMEVDGVVHEFLVGDISHPHRDKVYAKLEEMLWRSKELGYVADVSQVLQDVEGEGARERMLWLHSEKLAMAFGLISTSGPSPIRISKNLRVCEDCHAAAKFVSEAYDREILLRDRYRFHRFSGGRCSCGDFW
ncbi:hypothetical protein Taro_010207 [Colocasia esculenta]|uniref:DYW domain-containing protein n=1 Tax=Colocasia esculenta TaxID=4460 RepID=A0A843U8Y4_COLES|nr:hypothetical protein [Colocasia esculenta]